MNAVGGDYINNSGIAGAGRRRDQSFSNATTTTTATNAVNVDELEKELFGKHARTHQPVVAEAVATTQGAAESGSKGGATSEKRQENGEGAEDAGKNEATGHGAEDKEGEEGDDCSESRDDEAEEDEALAGEDAVEEEPEVKVREN